MNRVREGFCLVANPFNPRQISRVSLKPDDVEAFVFWSKNPKPLLADLDELCSLGFLFYFQFTLNDYPKLLEPEVPCIKERLDTFQSLTKILGPDKVVWRYDPILISNQTNLDYHYQHFKSLADLLSGNTRRVMVSFVDYYQKTKRRLAKLREHGLVCDENHPNQKERAELLSEFGLLAKKRNIEIFTCAEEHDYSQVGILPGSCIDGSLIQSIGGNVSIKKDPGQRRACNCTQSKDIGINDTCLHGCRYCYATKNTQIAKQRHAQHDPKATLLWG
jgi:DNA repair photolyase